MIYQRKPIQDPKNPTRKERWEIIEDEIFREAPKATEPESPHDRMANFLDMTRVRYYAYKKPKTKIPIKSIQILAIKYHYNLKWIVDGTGPKKIDKAGGNAFRELDKQSELMRKLEKHGLRQILEKLPDELAEIDLRTALINALDPEYRRQHLADQALVRKLERLGIRELLEALSEKLPADRRRSLSDLLRLF